ncbi:four helix bundle protein [Emticicia agri]|uniref:Four helix bundle protein n=1 Tax=Emticicia agri TaxID=2492393 RepID=A0A4Q5LXK6_9BACT|nr:four helix bundle protein [Emticicia agri]RYU94287.1 four helix bundle protein [Emticicia agri]
MASIKRKFRFEDLEIWQSAIEVGDHLCNISDTLENKKLFRFAEQLRGCGMSISNNIAEGAGSFSDKEFILFLNYARRSCFESANILIILLRRNLIDEMVKNQLFEELEVLSRKITNFQKTLRG